MLGFLCAVPELFKADFVYLRNAVAQHNKLLLFNIYMANLTGCWWFLGILSKRYSGVQ